MDALSKRKAPMALAALLAVLYGLWLRYRKSLLRRLKGSSSDWPGNVWLDQRREEAIDPDVEVIDPHHHLWDPRVHPKGWPVPLQQIQMWYAATKPADINAQIVKGMKAANPAVVNSFTGRSGRQDPFCMPYMGPELVSDIGNRGCGKRGHNVVKTVYLECGWSDDGVEEALRPVGEARMVEEVHRNHPSICNGMVAGCNLMHKDVESTLKGLKEVPLVRGIRHSLSWTKDPFIAGAGPSAKDGKAASDPDFRRGFALLQKYHFTYDVWMFHEQLEALTDLAKAFPEQVIVVDHVAEPLGIGSYDRKTTFPVWEKGMRELAKVSDNVYVKLSGLGMCRPGFHWDDREVPPSSADLAEGFRPYFSVVIEAFGAKRCMFASNFPVDRVSFDYTVMWNAFKLIAKDYSAEEQRALMYGTAAKVYSL